MSLREYTSSWPLGARKIVLRNIPDAINTVAMKQTKDGGNTFSHSIPPACQIVISYYYPKKVFVVWNASIHRNIRTTERMNTLSIGRQNEALINTGFSTDYIKQVFKPLKQIGFEDCVELIVLVGENSLYGFCKSYEEYLIPNIEEIPEGKYCLYSIPGSGIQRLNYLQTDSYQIVERERERVLRAKRDPHFRKSVIERWGGRCIICGVTEKKILEAAHIYSVKMGGSDDPNNGYCLCANHHRMYDHGIIDIDIEHNSFSCENEKIKEMPWFVTAEARHFQLFLP